MAIYTVCDNILMIVEVLSAALSELLHLHFRLYGQAERCYD